MAGARGSLHPSPIVTEYAIPLLRDDDDLVRFWDMAEEHITVSLRGGFRTIPTGPRWPGTDPKRPWAVTFRSRCWDRIESDWVYEPSPSSRNAAFFKRCRFSLDDALDIAAAAAERERTVLIARYSAIAEARDAAR